MASNSKAAARAKAAEVRAAQAKKEARRRMLTIGGVLALVVLIIGGAVLAAVLSQQADDEKLAEAGAGASEFGVVIGPDDAPHRVVIYEDFLCPYCGALERETSDDLTSLAADGNVQVEYRPFVLLDRLGDYSMRATNAFAVVLDASGPEVAKTFHDLLFENQPSESDPDSVTDDDLVALAVEAGAVESQVRDGIENLSQEEWVNGATAEAQANGVTGTPTILLDGELFQEGSTVQELAANLIAAVE